MKAEVQLETLTTDRKKLGIGINIHATNIRASAFKVYRLWYQWCTGAQQILEITAIKTIVKMHNFCSNNWETQMLWQVFEVQITDATCYAHRIVVYYCPLHRNILSFMLSPASVSLINSSTHHLIFSETKLQKPQTFSFKLNFISTQSRAMKSLSTWLHEPCRWLLVNSTQSTVTNHFNCSMIDILLQQSNRIRQISVWLS